MMAQNNKKPKQNRRPGNPDQVATIRMSKEDAITFHHKKIEHLMAKHKDSVRVVSLGDDLSEIKRNNRRYTKFEKTLQSGEGDLIVMRVQSPEALDFINAPRTIDADMAEFRSKIGRQISLDNAQKLFTLQDEIIAKSKALKTLMGEIGLSGDSKEKRVPANKPKAKQTKQPTKKEKTSPTK